MKILDTLRSIVKNYTVVPTRTITVETGLFRYIASYEKALEVAGFFQAIQIVAGDIGQLPLVLYRKEEDGSRVEETNHPVAKLLKYSPNNYMTPNVFKEYMQSCLLIFQEAFAIIERLPSGTIVGLHPVLPTRVEVRVEQEQGQLYYKVEGVEGEIPSQNMVHILGFSTDGIRGKPLINLARGTVTLSDSINKMLLACVVNRAMPSGILLSDTGLTKSEVEQLKFEWEKLYKGEDNFGKVAVLTGGLKFEPLQYMLQDLQLHEHKKELRKEIASWFNIPLYKLGDVDAKLSTVQEQNRDYLQRTLTRWVVKWQEELNRKLLKPEEQETLYLEFNLNTMLRASLMERYNAYSIAISNGILSPNEVRELENLPKYDGGDKYFYPVNIAKENEEDGSENSTTDENGSSTEP